MKNGKCPTWFVVKWLGKHPTHTATADRSVELREMKAWSASGWTHIEYRAGAAWVAAYTMPPRSDWTIYDEHGIPVEFKRKRESLVVGELRKGEGLLVVDGFSGEVKSNLLTNGGIYTVDILIRERRK